MLLKSHHASKVGQGPQMKGQGNFVIPFIFVQILRWDIFISNGESSSSLWYDFFLLLSKLLDIGMWFATVICNII